VLVATALGYRLRPRSPWPARECHDQVRLVARSGESGDGDWQVAVPGAAEVLNLGFLRSNVTDPGASGRRSVEPGTPCA
jgi:hypothetical protein